jgi:hypothetical protein
MSLELTTATEQQLSGIRQALKASSLIGNETISGDKNFVDNIFAKNLVYNTGIQFISGTKIFLSPVNIGSLASPDNNKLYLYDANKNSYNSIKTYSNSNTNITFELSDQSSNQIFFDIITKTISGSNNSTINFPNSVNVKENLQANNLIYNTGNQNISGNKNFISNIFASNIIYNTGDQTISGVKDFNSRITLNGTGFLISGEVAQSLPTTIVYTSGEQNIFGTKNFKNRPTYNGSGLALLGEAGGGGGGGGTIGSLDFDGNRSIKSIPNIGRAAGGSDVVSFLNNLFFPFVPATISLDNFGLVESGTTKTSIQYRGQINLNDENPESITNLVLKKDGAILSSSAPFSLIDYRFDITTGNQSITSNTLISVEINTDHGIITGNQNIYFVPPFYYGNGPTGLSSTQIKNQLTKAPLTFKPNSITQSFNSNNNRYYLAYSSTWGYLSSIKDSSFQDLTNSFTLSTYNSFINNLNYYVYIFDNDVRPYSNYQITFNF